MPKRRSLTEGLKTTPKVDSKQEAAFVHGRTKTKTNGSKPEKPAAQPPVEAPTLLAQPEQAEQPVGRSPLSTRLRADIGGALKRASLERQLAGLTPHTVQDIIELVLEPWLRDNGYLK